MEVDKKGVKQGKHISGLALAVPLWGWLLFVAWLSYDYAEYQNRWIIHILIVSENPRRRRIFIFILATTLLIALILWAYFGTAMLVRDTGRRIWFALPPLKGSMITHAQRSAV